MVKQIVQMNDRRIELELFEEVRELKADAFLLLTDVDAAYKDWGESHVRAIRRITPERLREFCFAPGSMGLKVEAAIEFLEQSRTVVGIGALKDVDAILQGKAGAVIDRNVPDIVWGGVTRK